MPTITGSIWAQNVGYRSILASSDSYFTDSVTLTFSSQGRSISADAAITTMWVDGGIADGAGVFGGSIVVSEYHVFHCGFTSIVSNGQYEELDFVPRIVRDRVTQLTFSTRAINCFVRSRWVINFWE